MPPVPFLNLVTIGIVLLISAIMMVRRPRDRKMQGLFLSALFLMLVLFVDDVALTIATHATSIRYDEYVFCFDRVFGSPAFAMGRLFRRYAWFHDLSYVAYVLAPSACLIVGAVNFFLLKFEDGVRCVRTVFLACLLAYPLFVVFPVAGPQYAFRTFPESIPANFVPHVVHLQSIPNGVPSVHMTLAILVLVFSKRWQLGRVLGSIFVLLTISSTMGLGEHYLFDLIVAVPYSRLVIYLGGYTLTSEHEHAEEQGKGILAGSGAAPQG